jgi:hypothetical protein
MHNDLADLADSKWTTPICLIKLKTISTTLSFTTLLFERCKQLKGAVK